MTSLQLQPHFAWPDRRERQAYSAGDHFYERLLASHQGLSDAQSELLNARLVLLLANHIGDLQVLDEALACARRQLPEGDTP